MVGILRTEAGTITQTVQPLKFCNSTSKAANTIHLVPQPIFYSRNSNQTLWLFIQTSLKQRSPLSSIHLSQVMGKTLTNMPLGTGKRIPGAMSIPSPSRTSVEGKNWHLLTSRGSSTAAQVPQCRKKTLGTTKK